MPKPAPEIIRVRLRAHLRPLRRGPGQIQFGISAEHGVVLEGLTDAEIGWLLSLSTRPGGQLVDRGLITGSAANPGLRAALSPVQIAHLVDLLRTHDLLVVAAEASDTQPHTASLQVSILGSGSTTESIRKGVAEVPSVTVWDALAPGRRPDLAIFVVNDTVGPSDAASWSRSGIRHTPVVLDQHRVLLGPLVEPGEGPCLTCMHLSRADRDPAWPLVAAQFDTTPCEWAAPVNADAALSATATGLAALLVRALVHGTRVPPGVTWEVNTPLPQVTTRHWLQHPLCSAHTQGHQWLADPEPHAAC
ncbi:MAG: hypothetical protein WBG36_03735 [Ornithinimicrobium sp.]